MPETATLRRVRRDQREGKAPSTQAGEFIREEMDHIREGKHGARSAKQAIAIGLSKARRAGVELAPPKRGSTSAETRKKAARESERGRGAASRRTGAAARRKGTASRRQGSAKRARASETALKREPRAAASHSAISAQSRRAARMRTPAARSAAARRGAATRARLRPAP